MDLSGYLLAWRTTALPDREVIDALVHPAHAGPSSALAAALADWPGGHYWSDEPDGRHLVLTRPIGRRAPRRDPVRPEPAGAAARHVPVPAGLHPRLGQGAPLLRTPARHSLVPR